MFCLDKEGFMETRTPRRTVEITNTVNQNDRKGDREVRWMEEGARRSRRMTVTLSDGMTSC